jgi:hypothetical protein
VKGRCGQREPSPGGAPLSWPHFAKFSRVDPGITFWHQWICGIQTAKNDPTAKRIQQQKGFVGLLIVLSVLFAATAANILFVQRMAFQPQDETSVELGILAVGHNLHSLACSVVKRSMRLRNTCLQSTTRLQIKTDRLRLTYDSGMDSIAITNGLTVRKKRVVFQDVSESIKEFKIPFAIELGHPPVQD